jgi:hypothetical protein
MIQTKLGKRTYEKVCSTHFSGEDKTTVSVRFYPQSKMKVEKKRIDIKSLLNKPKVGYISKLYEVDDYYRLKVIQAEINRKRREKENAFKNKLLEFWEHDVPALYNFLDKLEAIQTSSIKTRENAIVS